MRLWPKSGDTEYKRRVSSFWDANKWEKVPPYWAGFAPVQDYLAARAGSPSQHYHMSLLKRHCAGRTFRNGISLACGLGRAERAFAELGMAGRITGIDLSPLSIDRAREEARRAGVGDRLQYVAADVEPWLAQQDPASIDLTIAVGGLHHMPDPMGLLGAIRQKMTDDGILFVDEYVGPDYYQYPPGMLEMLNDLLAALHPAAPSIWPSRWEGFSKKGFLDSDPSEGVAASRILPAIREHFDLIEQLPLCGNLMLPLFGYMHAAMTKDPSCQPAMAQLAITVMEFERQLVAAGRLSPYFLCLIARPKKA